MITSIKTVTIYVADQERSLAFYTGVLGMEKHTDAEMWPGARWLEVVPPGSATTLTLAAAKDFEVQPAPGAFTLTLGTADVRALRERLQAEGVETGEVQEEGSGTYLGVKDPDGYEWVVSEDA